MNGIRFIWNNELKGFFKLIKKDYILKRDVYGTCYLDFFTEIEDCTMEMGSKVNVYMDLNRNYLIKKEFLTPIFKRKCLFISKIYSNKLKNKRNLLMHK